jgi:hypothetical protein
MRLPRFSLRAFFVAILPGSSTSTARRLMVTEAGMHQGFDGSISPRKSEDDLRDFKVPVNGN